MQTERPKVAPIRRAVNLEGFAPLPCRWASGTLFAWLPHL